MEILDRINELCKEKGITRRKMETEAGLSTGSTSKWKNGFRPNNSSLQKLSAYFGVSVSYLVGESEFRTEQEAIIQGWNRTVDTEALADETKKYEKGQLIPVLGTVVAGIPLEAVEEILDWEEISVKLARTGEFFALKIKGDSMSPRILEGDVVIVRQQADADTGDIVIAKINGDDSCCKRLIKNKEGITLQSFNPNYEPMYFSNQDILDKPVTIIGKVVELRGKFA